ncbi:hypothetical protein [Haloarchaeobius sp. DFWS5]|jgi:hypothetical protein|uniref:hypothetical protein n=1 Tax=Haloarchaeobius sp. DFWS5 TaxID=3446114 RepID=UPI003EB73511
MRVDNTTPASNEPGLLFRFTVWVLAAILLGRFYGNNSLYDVQQLTFKQVAIRLGTLSILGSFFYWIVFLARHDVTAIVATVAGGYLLMMFGIPVLFIRIMTIGADSEERADARRWKAITDDRDFD